jgi:hypothetical protein
VVMHRGHGSSMRALWSESKRADCDYGRAGCPGVGGVSGRSWPLPGPPGPQPGPPGPKEPGPGPHGIMPCGGPIRPGPPSGPPRWNIIMPPRSWPPRW